MIALKALHNRLGRTRLDELTGNGEPLVAGVLAKLSKLRLDREHLPPKVNGFAQRIPTGHRNRAGSWKNERDNLLEVLRQANGNQSEAAKLMGVSRVTIWKRIKKYGINLNTDLAE